MLECFWNLHLHTRITSSLSRPTCKTKDSRFYKGKARKYRPKRTPYAPSRAIDEGQFYRFLCGNLFRIMFFGYILWENYRKSILEVSKHSFRSFDFFRRKNVRGRVLTYLWERDIRSKIITGIDFCCLKVAKTMDGHRKPNRKSYHTMDTILLEYVHIVPERVL